MKNTKKLIIVCLSFLICLGLSACKSDEEIKKEEESKRAKVISMINSRIEDSNKAKGDSIQDIKNNQENRETFIEKFKKEKPKFKDEDLNSALDKFIENYEDDIYYAKEQVSFFENITAGSELMSYEKDELKTILKNFKESTIKLDESYARLYEKYSIKYNEEYYKKTKEDAERLKNPKTIAFGNVGQTQEFKIKPLRAYKNPDFAKDYSDGGVLDDKNIIMLDLEIENISNRDEINMFVSDTGMVDEIYASIQDENGYQLGINNTSFDDSMQQKIIKKGAKVITRLTISSKNDFAKRLKLTVNPYWDNITFDIPVN